MQTIAIIDDDIHIGDMLEEALRKECYNVIRAYSGTEALYLLESKRPDLILLDLMMPGLTGEEVLPRIKNIPVIVMSAKVGIDDKVNLLTGGAVDYVTKPFNVRELIARIEVHIRLDKAGKSAGGSDANGGLNGIEITGKNSLLRLGDLTLDPQARQAFVGTKAVKLTKTEYAILKLLMKNPTQAIAKSVILDRISEDTPDCTEGSLKIHVSNLRRKLRDVSGKDYIEAVWGIGFKMAGF